jgi:hypothetical protein
VDGKEFTHYGRHDVRLMTANGHQTNWSFNIVRNDQATTPSYDPYSYPTNSDANNYPNTNPNHYPTSDPNHYPTDPYDSPDDGRIDIEDILPSIIRMIPNR